MQEGSPGFDILSRGHDRGLIKRRVKGIEVLGVQLILSYAQSFAEMGNLNKTPKALYSLGFPEFFSLS